MPDTLAPAAASVPLWRARSLHRALSLVAPLSLGLALALVGLALGGCASHPPASPELTAFAGPLAVPYADSVDAAWADSASTRPEPPNPTPRPKRKRTSPAPAAGTAAATPEATVPETPAAPAVTAPPAEVAAPEAPAPQLSVRLAPADAAKLMERWQSDVSRAEKALELLKSFNLTGESADQVASARKFLGESRGARTASDFYRACELAEKARVLAEAVKASVGLK